MNAKNCFETTNELEMTSFLSSAPSSYKYGNQDAKYPVWFLESVTRNKPVSLEI